MLSQPIRDTFDAILEAEIETLPPHILAMLEASPVIVEDEPDPELLASLGMSAKEGEDLFGLHDGIAETERSVEDSGVLPTQILLFRGPIIRLAEYKIIDGQEVNRDALIEQVHITLLHEIGHQFGLDEDDLAELGYD